MRVCQFVNSYASFFYLAFISKWIGECEGQECMSNLALNLGIIFANQLLGSPLIDFFLNYANRRYRLAVDNLSEESVKSKSRVEREYYLEPVSTESVS